MRRVSEGEVSDRTLESGDKAASFHSVGKVLVLRDKLKAWVILGRTVGVISFSTGRQRESMPWDFGEEGFRAASKSQSLI